MNPPQLSGLILREARDDDADGVIALVDRVYREYEGCVLDVDGEEPELRSPASSFDGFWVVEKDGEIVGSCGYSLVDTNHEERLFEIKKVYLDRMLRGQGIGRHLIELLESRADELDADRIQMWSDTRFETAHKVYLRLGYTRPGKTRDLNDKSGTTEYYFEKCL